MKPFPSNKIMLITTLLVTLGFGIKFMTSSNEQFFQLNFDWDKEKPIKDLGTVILDSVSYNYVMVSNNNFRPNPQNTYKLSTKNESYYFRYVFVMRDAKTIQFKGVEWITDIPERTKIKYSIEEVFLPLKEGTGPTVVVLGDRLLIENEGKYYKRDLRNISPVIFKGKYYDVFDFPHEALKNNTSASILAQTENIPTADYYILMFGTNENLDSLATFQNNTVKILTALQAKNPQKIVLITMPPSRDAEVDQKHKTINDIFTTLSSTIDLELIDTFRLFSQNLDKYIRKDSVNISRDGYYELAKETAKRIK